MSSKCRPTNGANFNELRARNVGYYHKTAHQVGESENRTEQPLSAFPCSEGLKIEHVFAHTFLRKMCFTRRLKMYQKAFNASIYRLFINRRVQFNRYNFLLCAPLALNQRTVCSQWYLQPDVLFFTSL